MEMGGTEFADGSLFGRMFSHKGLKGTDDVPPKVLAYIEKNAPDFLTLPSRMVLTFSVFPISWAEANLFLKENEEDRARQGQSRTGPR